MQDIARFTNLPQAVSSNNVNGYDDEESSLCELFFISIYVEDLHSTTFVTM